MNCLRKSIADWLMRFRYLWAAQRTGFPRWLRALALFPLGSVLMCVLPGPRVFFGGLKSHEELGPGVYSGLQSGSAGWAEIIDAPVLFINNTTTCEHCTQQLAGAH